MRPAPEGLNNQDHTSLPVYGAAQNAEYLPPFPVVGVAVITLLSGVGRSAARPADMSSSDRPIPAR